MLTTKGQEDPGGLGTGGTMITPIFAWMPSTPTRKEKPVRGLWEKFHWETPEAKFNGSHIVLDLPF